MGECGVRDISMEGVHMATRGSVSPNGTPWRYVGQRGDTYNCILSVDSVERALTTALVGAGDSHCDRLTAKTNILSKYFFAIAGIAN